MKQATASGPSSLQAGAEAGRSPPPQTGAAGTAQPQLCGANGLAWRRFWLVALSIVVLDQLSKWWVVRRLTDALGPEGAAQSLWQQTLRFWRVVHPEPTSGQAVFTSWWHFRYVENPGAAWGFLSQSAWGGRTLFFVAIAALAMGFLLQYFRRTNEADRWLRFGLAIVFGGACGNLIDRTRLGYVIDFVDWHLGSGWHWPTFNVADAAITCGVGLLLLDVSRPPAPQQPASE